MNGRIYDPLMGRFLSADLFIQFPGSLQSFNRYSYVHNNPLTLTDPSGWLIAQMLPGWAQPAFGVTGLGLIDRQIDTAREAAAVTVSQSRSGDNPAVAVATGVAVGASRATGAMDWAEAVHGQSISVAPNGDVSVQDITSPTEVAVKAVGGATGMVTSALGISQAVAPMVRAILSPAPAAVALGDAAPQASAPKISSTPPAEIANSKTPAAPQAQPPVGSDGLPQQMPEKIYRGATQGNPNHVALREGEPAVSFRDSASNPIPEPGASPQPVLKPGRNFIEVETSKLPPGTVTADGGTNGLPAGHVSVTATPEEILAATTNGGKFPK